MTRDEAEAVLTAAGEAGDTGFPLLEAAIACAVHDRPFREPRPHMASAADLARHAEFVAGLNQPLWLDTV